MKREEAIKHARYVRELSKDCSVIALDADVIDALLSNPWHKVSEELPKVDKDRKCIKIFARSGDDVFVAFYSPVAGFSLSSSFYIEFVLPNIEYWMPIPELPKED